MLSIGQKQRENEPARLGELLTPTGILYISVPLPLKSGAFLLAQTVKNLPAVQETWLGKIPGEGNGNPLQYSCLENSMGRGAWQATVHGVTESRTGLSD